MSSSSEEETKGKNAPEDSSEDSSTSSEPEETAKGGTGRTAKAQAGSIQSIIKIGVVGDGTVGKTTLVPHFV